MNKSIIRLAAIAITAFATGANAAETENRGFYLSGSAGVSILRDGDLKDSGIIAESEFDNGLYISAALGYHVAQNIRLEGEFAYRRNSLDNIAGLDSDGDVNAYSLMANGYYDFSNSSKITPYIGAGLGATHIRLKDVSVIGITLGDSHDTVFSYQGIAGIAVNVTPNTKLGLEYKYLGISDPNFDGTKAEYHDHAIGVKLTYNF